MVLFIELDEIHVMKQKLPLSLKFSDPGQEWLKEGALRWGQTDL